MKISRKTYYGLRAVLALAQAEGALSIQAIAEREELPAGYLEKVLQALRRAGIVEAKKGTTGGYALARAADQISAWEIISALDGPVKTFLPQGAGKLPCFHVSHCQTNEVLRELDHTLEASLSQISLAQLVSPK